MEMLLSEAMRLGAMTGPQAFGKSTDGDASCALGAAVKAVGKLGAYSAARLWPWILDAEALCPSACVWRCSVEAIIIHLNDGHRWTRERIADWVATIEPQEPAPVQVLDSEVSCVVK